MKTFFQKVFAIVLTLTILVSALPLGAISVLAAELGDAPQFSVGDTTTTKTDAAPEDVDGGVWVLKESTTLSPNPSCKEGLLGQEHVHGVDTCVYLTCEHYQRDLLGDAHDLSCYGIEETTWEVCPGGDHKHTAAESGYTVYLNSDLKSLWQPISDAAKAEFDATHDVSEYSDTKIWGVVITTAQQNYDIAKEAYAVDAVKNTAFCYTVTSELTCGHGDECTSECCSLAEHTHRDGEDGCYEYTWVLEADVNNNNIVDGTEGDPYYTVTFTDGVDGEEIFADVELEFLAGADGNLIGTPVFEGNTTREHYTFAGFEGYDPEATLVAGDYTFVAQWTPNNYTITWDAGEGTFADGETTIDTEFAYGTMPSAPAIPSKEATQEYTYNFLGWTPDISAVAGNTTYVAQFGSSDTIAHTITIVVEGNGSYTLTHNALMKLDISEGAYNLIYANDATNFGLSISATPADIDKTDGGYDFLEGISVNGELVDGEFTSENGLEITITFGRYDLPVSDESVDVDINGFDGEGNWSDYLIDVLKPTFGGAEINVYYLAREAGTVPVTFNLNDLDLGWLSSLLPNETFTLDLPVDALWLNVDDEIPAISQPSMDELTALITEFISSGALFALNPLDSLKEYLKEAIAANPDLYDYYVYAGAHNFGENKTELVYFEVVGKEDINTKANPLTIEFEDNRENVTITLNNNVEVVYGQYTADELMALLAPVVKDSNGNAVDAEGLISFVTSDVEKFNVSDEITVEVKFEGNKTYKGATASANVIVKKAPVTVTVDNQIIKYGDKFNASTIVTSSEDVDTIQLIIGIDVSNAHVDGGIKGVVGSIQLLLPEELQENLGKLSTLLNGELGTSFNFADGASLKLSDLKKMVETLNKYASGSDYSDYISTLANMIESLPTDTADLEIVVGGTLPSNIGLYLVGAVTADSNYETAFGVGALAIYPNGMKAELDWKNHDQNHIITRTLLTNGTFDMGSKVVSVAEGNMTDAQNGLVDLFFGIDVDGNIIIETNQSKLNVGVYAQVAFIADFGNDMYYSKPIARGFAVVAEMLNVDFTDATGAVNNDRLFGFDNQPHSMDGVKITYTQDGDGYKAGDVVEGGDVKIYYVGAQTNGKLVYGESAPVHAGVYTVVAVYTLRDADGNITHSGVGTGVIAIEPAKSDINVNNVIKEHDNAIINAADLVNASSAIEGITPDITIITAGIATDGTFSENGILALTENVNIDLPSYLDELFAKYNVLGGRRTIDKYTFVACLNAANETFNKVGLDLDVIDALIKALEQVPANASITFKNQSELELSAVGAHLIIAVVTDSDHYPSMDAGICFIHPGVEVGELVWANAIDGYIVDIDDLTANYLDAKYVGNDEVNPTELYFGVNAENWTILLTNEQPDSLGAFLEIAYIFDINSQTYLAAPIARGFKLMDVEEPETPVDPEPPVDPTPTPTPTPKHKCESVCPECGLCLDKYCTKQACLNKCEGHEEEPTPEHECESVCSKCGRCLDKSCTESACSSKCKGHDDTTDPDPNPTTPTNPTKPTTPQEPDDDLSGGEVAAIVVGSTVIAGAGGFSVVWFVVQKKSLADLLAILKKIKIFKK